MITGYYQDTAGSSQFLKRPNMMFNFTSRTSDPLVKLYDSTQWRRYNLLDYCGITCAEPPHPQNIRIECARVLSFWYIYFEYFVDQNIGYRPDPIFKQYMTNIYIRLEDGTKKSVPSIMNWEQFCQIVLFDNYTSFPAVANMLTIGDCIEHGVDIVANELSNNLVTWLFTLPSKCWPKDYFTSALPWAQKGNPVSVPVNVNGGTVPITGTAQIGQMSSNVASGAKALLGSLGGTNSPTHAFTQNSSSGFVEDKGNASLLGNITGSATLNSDAQLSFLINDLRQSYALQEWLEKNSRCGSRYVEQILSHFGVRTSDSRLQRPEYLGGFKIPVHVSSTAQTSENGSTPQGNLAGQGLAAGVGKRITFFAEEHTLLVAMLYVQPKPYYSQGLSRLLTRNEFYDFYFPEFAHLGEQAITNKELYYVPDYPGNENTFGYQSRYSEYKFMLSQIKGDFTNPDGGLRSWLFGVRDFASQPSLSPEFLQCSSSVDSSLMNPFPVVESDSEDKLYVQVDFDLTALRPMPKYGTPYL